MLDRITDFHGRLSDLRVVWWPFLFLKPASARTPITWRRLALMIPCFAGWLLIGWLLRAVILGDFHSLAMGQIARAFLYIAIGFLLWFNLVTAPLWNRRARLLQNETESAPGT